MAPWTGYRAEAGFWTGAEDGGGRREKCLPQSGPLAGIDDGYTIRPIDISLPLLIILKLEASKRKENRNDE